MDVRSGGLMHNRHWLNSALARISCALLIVASYQVFAQEGVTATRILIGQSAAFSGPASELGNEMRAGALAYFDQVNKKGGIQGRKIELMAIDDGYEPDRAAANTKK